MANHNSWAASAASRRKTAVDNFWKVVGALWPNEYDYTKFEYLGATKDTVVTCKQHGDFVTRPTYLVNGNGCPLCGREKVNAAASARKLGMAGFIAKAAQVHGDKYSYPEQEYVGNKVKVEIVCAKHGAFWQKPNSHLGGKGCPECANDKKRERNALISGLVKEGLLSRLKSVNARWEYDITSFQGMAKPLRCVCPDHGEFFAWPNNLLHDAGCAQCGQVKLDAALAARRLTLEEVTQRGRAVYGDLFEYYKVEPWKHGARVFGKCKIHGTDWHQSAHDHVKYNPCGRCTCHLSRGEDAVFWLISNYTPAKQRDREILRPKELDIYIPSHNLAIEYCGEFWHSLGSVEEVKAKKAAHHEKYLACKALGIRLLTVYESEWLQRGYALRRLFRNALGKGRGKLMARKCELKKVPNKEARSFYERYHPQGGDGSGEHYGLYWNGKLVACMRFSFGTNDRGSNKARVWTLARYATRITVAGAASRLFKAFITEHAPTEVKSFSDNRYFEGGMYEQLGFRLEEDTGPDYQVWSPKIGLRPKPHYQRRNIPQRLRDHGMVDSFDPDTDPRTEAEMTFLMGCRRLYDCGKKRWVWLDPNGSVC